MASNISTLGSVFGFQKSRFNRPVSIAPLVLFRMVFGLLMCFSLCRFLWRGWVEAVYLQPKFHFTYSGFEWVQSLGNPGMYILFAIVIVASLCITAGLFYRIAAVIFFLGFTYIELIDVTTYLNHYYFISLVSFLMIWLPANRYYALDVYFNPSLKRTHVPLWTIGVLRFQLAVVYVFAGLAKLNTDWLLNAEPMRTWLPAKSHLPIVGKYMYQEWVAYLFSWFGAVYDLFIAFFMLHRKTRPFAYLVVIVFHAATAIFFPSIGMFPYIMIVVSLIFFSSSFHNKILNRLPGKHSSVVKATYQFYFPPTIAVIGFIYIFFQILFPLRFLIHPGNLFWHEQGYRFSWRVMLMEKAGTAFFTVKDDEKIYEVNNREFLTPLQEKMMSTQPDMILKYAHYLVDEYKKKGLKQPQVYAEIYVTLNGRPSRLFIDSSVNLAAQKPGWQRYSWVLPYHNLK